LFSRAFRRAMENAQTPTPSFDAEEHFSEAVREMAAAVRSDIESRNNIGGGAQSEPGSVAHQLGGGRACRVKVRRARMRDENHTRFSLRGACRVLA
jgi:hypothetical protein